MKKIKSILCGGLMLIGLSACQTTDGGFDLSALSLDGSGIAQHIGTGFEALKGAYQASRPITDSEEYYVGRAVGAKILASYPYLDHRAKNRYLNKVGKSLALFSEEPQTYGGYHFAFLNSPELNAFACPGGTIFITTGMLTIIENEDELAAVLAHEIAHVNRKHGVSSIKSARWAKAVTAFSKKASSEYGSSEFNEVVELFDGAIDDVFQTLVVKGYGRPQERQADKDALVIMQKAGYDPYAFLSFLGKLKNRHSESSGGGILSTHPGIADRYDTVAELVSSPVISAKMAQRRQRFVLAVKR